MGFLTDLKIRTAVPRAKEYLIADGSGLYLRVRATSKSWLYEPPRVPWRLVGLS